MEFEEYLEYIEKRLHEKNINTETQDYIIKYVYMNQKLFGKHLNIDKLVSRILNNLNHNITSFDINNTPLNELKRIITTRGRWDPYQNKITINPVNKLKGMLFKREKQKHNSSIMHEIDHCATTEYLQISKPEYEQYIQSCIKRNHIENPQDISKIKNLLNQNFLCSSLLSFISIYQFAYFISYFCLFFNSNIQIALLISFLILLISDYMPLLYLFLDKYYLLSPSFLIFSL